MNSKSRRFNSAHVIALIALFVALAGTTWASVHLGKNAVKSKNLKDGAVTNSKIAANAVDGGKIAANAVTGAKIADGAVTAAKIGGDAQVASAKVSAAGALVAGTSGVSVTKVGTGVYCLSLPFQPKSGAATIDESVAGFPLAYLSVPATGACTASGKTNAQVNTFLSTPFASTPVATDEIFHSIFH